MSSALRILGVIVAAALTGGLAACGTPSQSAHPAAASPASTAATPASTAATPASTAATPVRVQPDAVGWSGMVQRPPDIYVGMGGAPVARQLTWHHWGSSRAWASGKLDIFWPQAGPISGWRPTIYPVTVRLQGIQTHNGQPSYRQMAYSYVTRRGISKSLRFKFSVQPGGSLPSWNQLGRKQPDNSAGGPGVV